MPGPRSHLALILVAVSIAAAFLWIRLDTTGLQSPAVGASLAHRGSVKDRAGPTTIDAAHIRDTSAGLRSGSNPAYDPDSPLAPQLPFLRRLSDRNDPYATCILAFALDVCARGPERMIIETPINEAMANPDEKSVTRIAESMEFKERYAQMCGGLDKASLTDMDRRLLQSAELGHIRSMTRFALLPYRQGGESENPNSGFSVAYRNKAESMLNKAAEAGDPEAIRGVYYAYAQGYITSAMGSHPIEKDAAKSLAALRILSLHSADVEDKESIERKIQNLLAQMPTAEVSRFWKMDSTYTAASYGDTSTWQPEERVLEDFPERACGNASRR